MKRSHITLMILSVCLSAFLLLGLGSAVSAQPFGGHRGGPEGGLFSQLTDEQRQAVRDLVGEMRAEGASRQEIHEAISELFAEWGIEMPERPGGPRGQDEPRGPGHDGGGFWEELTEEQRAAIRSQIFELWQDGATEPEIHDVVREMLSDYGIELPEPPEDPRPRGGHGHPRFEFMSELSEEQRKEIRDMIQEMRDQDATREEIRAAVEQKLAEWGIELPEPPPELTVEQRKTLRAVVFELWQNGATGQEIRSAAGRQLEDFGLPVPEHGRGPLEHGPWPGLHGCLRPPLTEQQRETIHETIEELRLHGASPEEIRQAVQTLMSDFGIEMPDLDAELTNGQRAALRSAVLDLWLAGADREDICQAVRDLLEEFGIELPESSGELQRGGTSGPAPIQAQNFPNPANPETQIQYTLNVPGKVQVQIYNVSGQLVRSFDMGYLQPGSYSVTWDGRGHDGVPVASGVYLYKIQTGLHSVTNRMVLLR